MKEALELLIKLQAERRLLHLISEQGNDQRAVESVLQLVKQNYNKQIKKIKGREPKEFKDNEENSYEIHFCGEYYSTIPKKI